MSVEQQAVEMLESCILERASDVYLLPDQKGYRILTKINQKLVTKIKIDKVAGESLINYFKFAGKMSVSETRRPQIGSLSWRYGRDTIYLRLSSVGDFLNKESLVIRLIYPITTECQFVQQAQYKYLESLSQQRGLLLFAGPTGSGKTTTMYRLIQQFAEDEMILAIEDPIEIQQQNILQLQVNNQADMSYEALLKVSLRHRPDVLIIGEIRDETTASAAITAALSGHLVLSTIHSRSALGAIERLKDFGQELGAMQQALTGICYQRLIPLVKQGMAIHLDILAEARLQQAYEQTSVMTNEWRNGLKQAYNNGDISFETYQTYRYG